MRQVASCHELEGEGLLEENGCVGLGAFSWVTSWGLGIFFFFLIPKTYQNGTVLVSVGNPNFNQNDAVLILILIFFFSPRGHFSNLSMPK
jgi:hypothetical protein